MESIGLKLSDVSRPFPGEGPLRAVAAQEAAIVAGHVPDEFRPAANTDALYAISGKSSVLTGAALGGPTAAAMGVVGRVSWPVIPAMTAVGALAGAAWKWNEHRRHDQGTVTVTCDGVPSERPFRLDPARFERTSEEARLVLTAEGRLGDKISLSALPELPPAPAGTADDQRELLLALGKQRRLVADLGHTSSYGHQVLDLVDASTARKLLAADKGVFVVDGQGSQDQRHSYSARATSRDGQVQRDEQHQLVERQFRYGLRPLAQVHESGPGQGLPAGWAGIYKNASVTGQVVYTNNQMQLARVDGKVTTRDQSNTGVATDSSVAPAARMEGVKIPLTHGDVSAAVAFGFVGTLAGAGISAVGLPLVTAPLVGGAAAALGYNVVGPFIQRANGLPAEG